MSTSTSNTPPENKIEPRSDSSNAIGWRQSISRIKGKWPVIVSAAGAVGTQISQLFKSAVWLLEKLDLADFTGNTFAGWVGWLFSPSGAQTLFVLFLAAFFLALFRLLHLTLSSQQPDKELESLLPTDGNPQSRMNELEVERDAAVRVRDQLRIEVAKAQGLAETHGIRASMNQNLLDQYQWLHALASVQANDIEKYVVAEKVYFCYHKLTDPLPRIVFGADIFNKTIFDITIEDTMQGYIEIAGQPLLRDKRFIHNAKKISPISEGKITIEQRLSPEEAALIAECDEGQLGSIFYFDKLIIMIGKGTQYPGFERTRLILPQLIGSKDTPVTTALTSLKAQQEKNKWLHEIAKDQAETIYRWVCVTRCAYTNNYDLMRDDPHVEFVFYVHNRSVYNVQFDSLDGRIFFAGRQLTGLLRWIEKPEVLTYGNEGSFIIQQSLSKEDALHIRNASDEAYFDLERLKIIVGGNADFKDLIIPRPLQVSHCSVTLTNKEFLTKYPKIKITIERANLRAALERKTARQLGSYILMEVSFENPRSTALEIQSFKLKVEKPGWSTLTIAREGEIREFYTFEDGRESLIGGQLENLNVVPFSAEQWHTFKGWLLFVIPGIMADNLEECSATLRIVDAAGEEHPAASCPLERGN